VIGEIGVDGGTGHVIEYRGSAISVLTMEQRMTSATCRSRPVHEPA
jgi:3-isopropylmalate/(R)-2-methylmalate dehydratase large subunit